MRRIALAVLLNRPNSVLSPHFGKAKWIMIREEDGRASFEQNTSLNGRAVVDLMVGKGCTDAVFTHIGSGAFAHLEKSGIKGWIGPANVAVPKFWRHSAAANSKELGHPKKSMHPEQRIRVTADGTIRRTDPKNAAAVRAVIDAAIESLFRG